MGRVTGGGQEVQIPVSWFSVQIHNYLNILDVAEYVQESNGVRRVTITLGFNVLF